MRSGNVGPAPVRRPSRRPVEQSRPELCLDLLAAFATVASDSFGSVAAGREPARLGARCEDRQAFEVWQLLQVKIGNDQFQ
jgi:hypothetical protein